MADFTEKLTNAEAVKVMDQLNEPFKSLPHLPQGIIDFLVMIAPWLALLGGLVNLLFTGLYGLIGTLGSLLTLSPLLMVAVILHIVIAIVQGVILLMAFTPLRNRETKGWMFMFWSEILGIASIVVNLVMGGIGGLVGSVIAVLIGMYILFEMRSSYGASKALKD